MRDCREVMNRGMFSEHPDAIVNAWYVLSVIAAQVYEPGRRGSGGSFVVRKELMDKLPASALPADTSAGAALVACTGLFITFFISFGLDLPWVIALAATCSSRLACAEVLHLSSAHWKHFDSFCSWGGDSAAKLKMTTWCCSMELGNADDVVHPCAVHLHLWVTSASPREGAWLDSPSKVCVDRSSFEFASTSPQFCNVVPWRRSGPKSVMVAQRGLYYLLCRKQGSLHSVGTHYPFQAILGSSCY